MPIKQPLSSNVPGRTTKRVLSRIKFNKTFIIALKEYSTPGENIKTTFTKNKKDNN